MIIVLVTRSMFITLVLEFITLLQGCALKESLLLQNDCVCSGYAHVLAECTVAGTNSGVTVWGGSVFDHCASVNELVIFHRDSLFKSGQMECKDGSIVAQGVRVQDNYFTSQLSINITSNIIGKTVKCVYDDVMGNVAKIGSLIISETEPDMVWSPSTVFISLGDAMSERLSFTWSPVAPDCPAIHYNILASNCGSCPTTTNHTTVTCTDVPTNGTICTFAVQTVVCGRNIENSSDVFHVALYRDINDHHTCGARSSCAKAIVSAGLLAAIIVVCATSFVIVAAITVKRRHVTFNCFTKTFVRSRSPLAATIDTNENVAYGQVTVIHHTD